MSRIENAAKVIAAMRAAGTLPVQQQSQKEVLDGTLNAVTGGGVASQGKQVLVVPWTYYSKVAWSNSANQYQLFNFAGNNFATNLPTANQISNTTAFKLRTVRVFADTGYNLTTGAAAAGAQYGATVNPGENSEMLRIWHEQAKVEMWIGPRKIVECFAVDLPRGHGPANTAALVNSTASTINQAVFTNNGAPIDAHRDIFPGGFPIPAGENIQFTVTLPAALTLPNSGVGVVVAQLVGEKIEEAR